MKFLLFTKELIQNYSFMGVIHRTLGDKGYLRHRGSTSETLCTRLP